MLAHRFCVSWQSRSVDCRKILQSGVLFDVHPVHAVVRCLVPWRQCTRAPYIVGPTHHQPPRAWYQFRRVSCRSTSSHAYAVCTMPHMPMHPPGCRSSQSRQTSCSRLPDHRSGRRYQARGQAPGTGKQRGSSIVHFEHVAWVDKTLRARWVLSAVDARRGRWVEIADIAL